MKRGILGLGLESSCDETAASVVMDGKEILSSLVNSQIDLHKEYFGVVPEIASRAHLEMINPLIEMALDEAKAGFEDLDYVAVTNRPGLIGSLLITVQSAKAVSLALSIPLVAVSHLEAHLYAPFLTGRSMTFPFIGLLVSGGNTALYHVRGTGDLEIIGKTVDDAVGEAFDKAARFLGLGYPGGPAIEALSMKAARKDVKFSKILTEPFDTRFSYSGLKTALITFTKKNPGTDVSEIARAFQECAVELLARRAFSAARERGVKDIVVAGGVACNGRLREMLHNSRKPDENIIIPPPALCTDNAAMVAGLGYCYFRQGRVNDLGIDVHARDTVRLASS